MILCVGDSVKLGHLREALEQRLHQEVTFLPAAPDIRRQENDILLAAQGTDAIIYDTDAYYNDGEELIGVIKRIWRTNHAAPILLVPTDNPKNEIVKAALAVQIKNIINVALSPGEQKDQLEKILTGYYAANGDREDIRAAEDEVAEDTRTLTSFVGQLYLPCDGEGHIAIFGGSGQGKTSALLIPSLRVWQGPFFCIDISGDISKNVPGEKKVLLAPDDPEHSVIYNVFDEIDRASDPDERRALLEQLTFSILPLPPKATSAERYFTETARKILLASLVAFYDKGLDFCEIMKVVFTNGPMELFQLIAAQKNQRAVGYIQTLAQENEKNIAGAKSTLDENIKLFADYSKVERVLRRPSSADEPYLAPSDLESSHIFLVVPDKKQEFYSLFCNIVVTQMLDYIGQRPYDRSRDKRILLALDEFASLRHLEILGPMRKFRKNGANICILTQSLADIDLAYSRDERKVILDNCAYTVVLSGNDPETRMYFSDLVGKEEHRKISTTTGSRTDSTSTSLQEGYAIHPNTWKSLGEQLVVIHRTGYLKLRKNFYFKG